MLFSFKPNNKHQLPSAVILVGPSRTGAFGLAAARHLAAQGFKTVAYVPDLPHYPDRMSEQLKLYKLTGKKWTTSVSGKVDVTKLKAIDSPNCSKE